MRIPTNYGPDYAEPFAAIYGRVAEDLDVPIVPLVLEGVGGVDAMNLDDGIHPNEPGHVRMAENIRPVLEAALDRAAAADAAAAPAPGPAAG
jgi:acyl-CoA thioesterase-1